MKLTHGTSAKILEYLLLSCISATVVQISALWPLLKTLLTVIAAITFILFVLLFLMQYSGIVRGRAWAQQFTIDATNQGTQQFAAMVLFIFLGGGLTWMATF